MRDPSQPTRTELVCSAILAAAIVALWIAAMLLMPQPNL